MYYSDWIGRAALGFDFQEFFPNILTISSDTNRGIRGYDAV